jgi:putative intracellular protease/amidase
MFSLFGRRSIRPTRSKSRVRSLEPLESRHLMAADPLPVLMVIANQDFYYQEYADTRKSLEEAGLSVAVAATTTAPSLPHAGSGQGSSSGVVTPSIKVASADAEQYSAIVFVGGWGASSYQYAFQGTYANAAYNGDLATKEAVNTLVDEMLADDKPVAALCHGVSVLAWARVDGQSPLQGKHVAAYAGGSPGCTIGGVTYAPGALPTRWHIETNGGIQFASGSIGDPTTAADDVWVDGRIITAENFDSARQFGRVVGQEVIEQANAATPPIVERIDFSGGGVQRSMVTSLTVTFSETVQLASGAIQIMKLGAGGGTIATRTSRSVIDGKTVLRVTFASQTLAPGGSLSDGNYRLTIRGTVCAIWPAQRWTAIATALPAAMPATTSSACLATAMATGTWMPTTARDFVPGGRSRQRATAITTCSTPTAIATSTPPTRRSSTSDMARGSARRE